MADIFSTIRDRITSFLGVTHQGARDTYKQFGYPQVITPEYLWAMYLRNGMANRIVRTFPKATWRKPPIIWDEEGNSPETGNRNFSEFSASVDKLFNVHKAMTYFERADRVSGVGRFGLLVMGFRDGAAMDKPLLPGKHPLLFMSSYGELNVDVNQWDTDTSSPRYGLPTLYTCRTGSLSGIVSSGQVSHKKSLTVHHTRVLHLAEFLDEDDVYGTPRLVPVYNWLQDLEKTAGASAETFWFNSRPGLSMSADKEANYSTEAIADMRSQVVEYEHQLRRIFALQGITVSELTAPIADPEPNIEKLLDLIAGTCEIPKRILIGSERGELSSSQDENNFAARVQERSINYAGPHILKPFIQRMIETQNVEQPQGEWGIEWPNAGQTPEQAANIGTIRSATLRNYVTAPGAELIVPPSEFRREFLNLPPEPEELLGEEEPLDEELPGEEEVNPDDPQEGAGDEDAANAPPEEKLPSAPNGAVDPEDERVLAFNIASSLHQDKQRRPYWRMTGEMLADVQRLSLKLHKVFPAKPLYICREVLNAEELMTWARREGFTSLLAPGDLHVTVCYSTQPIDWMRIPEPWGTKDDGSLVIKPGGPRVVDYLGPRAVVLFFNSSDLCWRHETIKQMGASWPYDGYQPHITLTYEKDDLDLEDVDPYTGAIELGPEQFRELVPDWADEIREVSV